VTFVSRTGKEYKIFLENSESNPDLWTTIFLLGSPTGTNSQPVDGSIYDILFTMTDTFQNINATPFYDIFRVTSLITPAISPIIQTVNTLTYIYYGLIGIGIFIIVVYGGKIIRNSRRHDDLAKLNLPVSFNMQMHSQHTPLPIYDERTIQNGHSNAKMQSVGFGKTPAISVNAIKVDPQFKQQLKDETKANAKGIAKETWKKFGGSPTKLLETIGKSVIDPAYLLNIGKFAGEKGLKAAKSTANNMAQTAVKGAINPGIQSAEKSSAISVNTIKIDPQLKQQIADQTKANAKQIAKETWKKFGGSPTKLLETVGKSVIDPAYLLNIGKFVGDKGIRAAKESGKKLAENTLKGDNKTGNAQTMEGKK
jgi:hypothetical protein